jgi:hypothetical protein
MADKILVDEELLRAAFRMVGDLMEHYSHKARRYEIEKPCANWKEKSNKYLLKSEEAAEIYFRLDEMLEE